jgi:transcriptional regulator with XRE-family HTH domain
VSFRHNTKLVSGVKSTDTKMVLDRRQCIPYHIGMNELKRLRIKTKLSQSRLAELVGTQQPQIVRWEKDNRKIPVEWAVKLAVFFKCDPGDFLPEIRGGGLDALLRDKPDIKQQVWEYAEYLLKKTGS